MSGTVRNRNREAPVLERKVHSSPIPKKSSISTESGQTARPGRLQGCHTTLLPPPHSKASRVRESDPKSSITSSSLSSSCFDGVGRRGRDLMSTNSPALKKSRVDPSFLTSLSKRTPFSRLPDPLRSQCFPASLSSGITSRKNEKGGTLSSRSSASSRSSGQQHSPRSSRAEQQMTPEEERKLGKIGILEYEIAKETEVLSILEMRREQTLDALETMFNLFEERKNVFKEEIRCQEQEHLSAMKALVVRQHRCHTKRKGLQEEEHDMEDRIKHIESEKEILLELISMEERRIDQRREELVLAGEQTEHAREITASVEAESKLLEQDGYGLSGEVKDVVIQTKAVERKTKSIGEESMKLEVIRRELFSEAEALNGSIRVFGRVRGKSKFPFVELNDQLTSRDQREKSPASCGSSSGSPPGSPRTSEIVVKEMQDVEEEKEVKNNSREETKEMSFFSADAAIHRVQQNVAGGNEGAGCFKKGLKGVSSVLCPASSLTSSSSLHSRKVEGTKRERNDGIKSNMMKKGCGSIFMSPTVSIQKSTLCAADFMQDEKEEEELALFTFGVSREDQIMADLEASENKVSPVISANRMGIDDAEAAGRNSEEKNGNAMGSKTMDDSEDAHLRVKISDTHRSDKHKRVNSSSRIPHRIITIHQTRRNATSTGDNATAETFSFDRVFDENATQEQVYEPIEPLILNAMDGYSICIFAYGQTGSGKTFSMEGHPSSPELLGIIPRAMQTILSRVESLKEEGWEYCIRCSLIEIYNDTIRDLLQPTSLYDKGGAAFEQPQYHAIKQNLEDKTTSVTRVKERKITNLNDFWVVYKEAVRHRRTAATILNAHSSRSHCIFVLHLDGVNHTIRQRSAGKLCLVDLAGSERILESGVKGEQLKEAININKSLMNLGKCISAMRTSEVVPWRNSKLTYFLQSYLGVKGGKMLMLVTVSDKREHAVESANALRFASRVSETIVGPSIKRAVKY